MNYDHTYLLEEEQGKEIGQVDIRACCPGSPSGTYWRPGPGLSD